MTDLEARDSQGKANALRTLGKTISVGEERQRTVIQHALKRVIVDKLAAPTQIHMNVDNDKLMLLYDNSPSEPVVISNHALNQICGVTGIPKAYVNKLLTECVGMPLIFRMSLLQHIFNTHFHVGAYVDRKGKPAKFLHRLMNGELFGFLSRSYNRKLGTVAMMKPFLERCAAHGAKPTEALHGHLKTSLKCVQPIVYEPVDGEFVAFGATYTNSDFGAGGMTVSDSILRISTGTTSVIQDKLRRIHLGALITESEIELSEDTLEKESAAHIGAVKDTVNDIFSNKRIETSLELIRFAFEHKIQWERLKARAKDVLNKEELEKLNTLLGMTKEGIVDLPPVTLNSSGDPEVNAWWASAALGCISASITDVEKKVSIQELAGELLKK